MSNNGAAIGRQHGRADTDNNGLARFMLKIEVPGGIKTGNEPDLSLQYSQGTPNGIIGFSWALGGISSIRLGAAKVVYDKLNPPPSDYDSTKPKFILDGTDLLNIDGAYNAPGTVYTTETDNTGLRITSLGVDKGFMARDNMGRSIEYGTTLDSRTTSTSLGVVREYRVKRQTDCHGNTVVYNYITSPQTTETKDVNTSYLASILYCSNSVTQAPATRFVKFDYQPRPDLIRQSVEGDIITWANLLSAISLGVGIAGQSITNRSYSLSYKQSPVTGDSYLWQVMESAGSNAQKVNLLPSTFTYTVPGVDPTAIFKTVPASPFSAETNVFSLIPLNMTGRALADMACMIWDQASKTLTVKTYIAERNADATVSWSPSQTNVSLVLPNWDVKEMPDFMTPDLHGDGRSDLIIPFSNSQGNLEFFLSQSSGIALTATQQGVQTAFPWVPQSKFKAMDMTGTGVIDVVQIYQKGSNLSFRNFPGVADNAGSIGLGNAIETDTQYTFDNTIDWFLLRHSGTGAVSLVRVWQDFLPNDPNQYNIKTTSFRCAKVFDSSKGFDPAGTECVIGGPFPKQDPNSPSWSVLTCDINGDGTQDIVLGKAVHTPSDVTLTFQVSLGDGLGGFAKVSEITKNLAAPAAKGDGMFSITNIHGGLYPSLAYVYQRNDDSSFICLSVDGLSDSTISPVTQYPITSNPGTEQTQVMPVDLSATGMGGWLVYSLAGGVPTVVPVYNVAQPTDLLLSAENSMGLVSTFSYGCLSDSNVYNSTVDWKNYQDIETDNYIVQGAPNYVVMSLKHANNPTVNSVVFDVAIQKTYTKAIVNSQGRGWLGFESINTTNLTDNILTVEHYYQSFPKIGLKSQIQTFALPNQLVSSQTTDYEPVQIQTNAWNIFHINKLFDRVETDGPTGRIQLTQFTSDEYGNVTTKYSSEVQIETMVYQAWERCTYVTINGITGLLTGRKLSSVEANIDVSNFEAGDVALTHYTYSDQTALLSTELHWSDDVGKFLTTTYAFDAYGNETSKTDAAGLTVETTYDSTFNNLAIQQTERGQGVLTTQYASYDQATGKLVARLDTDGRLACTKVDGFGRDAETRMESITPGKASLSAASFFGQQPYVASTGFTKQLSSPNCLLDPFEQTSYNCFSSAGGKAYLTTSTLSLFNEDDSGQHEVVQVLDCSNQRSMQRSRQGMDPAKNNPSATRVFWEYWTYDSRGNVRFQSFPLPAAWNNFEYQPKDTEGTTSQYDTLGRIILQQRPSHNDTGLTITSTLTYANGGGVVAEKIVGPDPNIGSTDAVLWSAPRAYIFIDGKERVISSTSQDGLVSEFTYDVSGNMTSATDPDGKRETRVYNSLGQLRILDNCYQNMVDPSKPSTQPAMTYEYDGLGQMHKMTNANGEVVTFERDSKGRPVRKTGFDGRLLEYKYDAGGREGLTSMAVYPKGQGGPIESRVVFEYDKLARVSSRTLTLADQEYETTLSYDWQGQVMSKIYPNGATKANQYIGSLLSYSQLYQEPASGQRETWLDSRFEYTDATGKPTNIMVGQASMESDFYHTFTYDHQGFPITHALDQKQPSTGQSKTLVQEGYTYNGADQLAQRMNSMTNTITKYNYDGKRLKDSQIGNAAVKSYAYDKAGNLMTKGDTTITYSSNGARGVSESTTLFDILYDRAGRMVSRATQQESLEFTYDSFGLLASYTNSAQTKTAITCGPDGKTVQRQDPGNAGSIVLIGDDYNVRVQADGSKLTTLKLFGAGMLLASFSKMDKANTTQKGATVLFTDTKGNVTYRFKGSDASLVESITYDDFGSPTITVVQGGGSASDRTSTYESQRLDEPTGLLDFDSRWYDPLVGRFTTPDDILNVQDLARSDGLNRLAFENNDPINHTDPSGHWSWHAIAGAMIGAALVVGAIAVTVATGGAAAPLAAAAVGAMAGGGIAGITYSFDHRNERGGKFWGGYVATVLVNAAIGGASGALGAVATPARIASATGRLGQAAGRSLGTATENFIGRAASVGGKSLISATSSLLNTVAHNAIENQFYGTHHGLLEGAGKAFGVGALSGGTGAAMAAWKFTGQSTVLSRAETFKTGLKGGATIAGRAGWAVASNERVPTRAAHRLRQEAAETYHVQQTQFKSLSQMVAPSGFVGTLHKELQRNQSFVNYG